MFDTNNVETSVLENNELENSVGVEVDVSTLLVFDDNSVETMYGVDDSSSVELCEILVTEDSSEENLLIVVLKVDIIIVDFSENKCVLLDVRISVQTGTLSKKLVPVVSKENVLAERLEKKLYF
jgi:hypothetical protein